MSIKFNVAPSKHIGFINFINLALSQGNPIAVSFEKISKTGEKEGSKIEGTFKFEEIDSKSNQQLKEIQEEVDESDKRRKKQAQRRKQK